MSEGKVEARSVVEKCLTVPAERDSQDFREVEKIRESHGRRRTFAASLFSAGLPDDWRLVPVGEALTSSQYGLNEPVSSNGITPIVRMRDVSNGRVNLTGLPSIENTGTGWSSMRLRAGDVLLNRTNSPDLVGKVGIVREDSEAVFASYLVRLVVNRRVAEPEFVNYWLSTPIAQRALKRLSTRGVSQANINPTEFRRHCPLPLPPLPEQRKIAEILRTWDDAIEKLEVLNDRLERQSAAICRRIFESDYNANNRLLRAREVFEVVSERKKTDLPLLAVMQDIGIVRREELDRRVVMPEGDISSYKVVRPGDFVISLRSFEGGLEYSSIAGLVSPAYTVLRPSREIESSYYRHFFKSRSFIRRLDKLIFGIRDGKQIAFRDFGHMLIPNPSILNQRRQTALLDASEKLVVANKHCKKAFERQKRGLMQKLLTGEWRVSP